MKWIIQRAFPSYLFGWVAMDMRQKTDVPDGHWHTWHGATPYPSPVQRNSSDLGDSHKWPWSGLGGGGPDPWTPRPAPPLQLQPCSSLVIHSWTVYSAVAWVPCSVKLWRWFHVSDPCPHDAVIDKSLAVHCSVDKLLNTVAFEQC